MPIRKFQPSDSAEIGRILRSTGVFTAAEIAVAEELLGIAAEKPEQTDYEIYVTEDAGGRLIGYICFGQVPLTSGTFDLYWIAVDPAAQRGGAGRELVDFMETALRSRGARKIMVETSSQPSYDPTRAFYLRRGYSEAARFPDFYKPGDAKVVYCKELGRG